MNIGFGRHGHGTARDQADSTRSDHSPVDQHAKIRRQRQRITGGDVADVELRAERAVEVDALADRRDGLDPAKWISDASIQRIGSATDRTAGRIEGDETGKYIEFAAGIGVEDGASRRELRLAAREHGIDIEVAGFNDVNIAGTACGQRRPGQQADLHGLRHGRVDTVGRNVTYTAVGRFEDQVTGLHQRNRRIENGTVHLDPRIARNADVAQQTVAKRGKKGLAVVGVRRDRRGDADVQGRRGIEVERLALPYRDQAVGNADVGTLSDRQGDLLRIGQGRRCDAGRNRHVAGGFADGDAGLQRDGLALHVGALDHRVGVGEVLQ